METTGLLIVPGKADVERDALAQAWLVLGGEVLRLDRFWEPPFLPCGTRVALYGPDTFVLVLAQRLGLELVMVDDAVLAQLDERWLGRRVEVVALAAVRGFPCFLKPVQPKLFAGEVFGDLFSFREVVEGLPGDTLLLRSSVVSIVAEARAFVLNGFVCDLAIYVGDGDLVAARGFLEEFLVAEGHRFPGAFVLDLACLVGGRWCVLEVNNAWGAGLNGCLAERVLGCVLAASGGMV